MDEGYNNNNFDFRESDIVFSKSVKAGKRIYYFDVKVNRRGELFLSITESKKITMESRDRQITYDRFDKHKIFLYKEDFDRFVNNLYETIDYIRENNTVDFAPKMDPYPENEENTSIVANDLDLKIGFQK